VIPPQQSVAERGQRKIARRKKVADNFNYYG
jgi:hypothetical protein